MLSVEEVIAHLDQARRGDSAAYDRLYTAFQDALCGAIQRLWPYEARLSKEAATLLALQTWHKERASILRSPTEGGYRAELGAFHRWVIKACTDWRNVRPEDGAASKKEVAWPTDEHGGLVELPDRNQPTADEFIVKCRKFALLLEIVFLPKVGYPHQQLCFVLSKYVYGVRTPRGIDGSPALVVQRHRQMQLRELAQCAADAYRALDFPGTPFAGEKIPCFAQLYQRLELTISELMSGDGESLDQFKHLRTFRTADTRLEDYFVGTASDPEDAVSLWSHRVSRAVRRRLGPTPGSDESRFWSAAENLVRTPLK